MSRRNFILFIIALILILFVIFVFFYSQKGDTGPTNNEGGTNFFSRFNPFSKTPDATPKDTPPVDISGEVPDDTNIDMSVIKLRKISSMPVAGFGLFLKERLKDMPVPPAGESAATDTTSNTTQTTKPTPPPTELASATRYVARATGNIYQTFLDKIEERKFSTTIIPKVYEAIFVNKNTSVLMRYLKTNNNTIETFLGNIPKEVLGADTENNEIKGVFLSDGITDVSMSPDTTKLFYLLNVGDNTIGTILNIVDGKKTQVFDSPFNEWLSVWPNANLITLTTKPSANAQGHMYALNTTNKSFVRAVGDIYGLTTQTSPDGKFVLYGDSSLAVSIFDMTKKTSTLIGVRTLPEKCAWSGSTIVYCAVPTSPSPAQYPDSWYQGEVSFTDQIWKINIVSGLTEMLINPSTTKGGEDIDGIKLSVDAEGEYLLFVNKKDSFLWELNLN
jgi:hypothetical protein